MQKIKIALAQYPFIGAQHAFVVARVMTAIFFMAHAIVRIINDTIPQFGSFLTSLGFPFGEGVVWLITGSEIIAGCLLIANLFVRIAASVLFVIVATGIGLIHAKLGWFVGEHGTGGSEYSVALMLILLLVMVVDRDRQGE